MDSPHHHLYPPFPETIGDLISPGSRGGETRNANHIDFHIEIDGIYTLIGNRDLDVPRCIRSNHAQIERWGIGLGFQGTEETLLKKGNVGRINGVVGIDQFNSHFPGT